MFSETQQKLQSRECKEQHDGLPCNPARFSRAQPVARPVSAARPAPANIVLEVNLRHFVISWINIQCLFLKDENVKTGTHGHAAIITLRQISSSPASSQAARSWLPLASWTSELLLLGLFASGSGGVRRLQWADLPPVCWFAGGGQRLFPAGCCPQSRPAVSWSLPLGFVLDCLSGPQAPSSFFFLSRWLLGGGRLDPALLVWFSPWAVVVCWEEQTSYLSL